MKTPQYGPPPAQTIQGRVVWADDQPDPTTGMRDDIVVDVADGRAWATHPVGITAKTGDVVALTMVGSTLRLSGVISHAPTSTQEDA